MRHFLLCVLPMSFACVGGDDTNIIPDGSTNDSTATDAPSDNAAPSDAGSDADAGPTCSTMESFAWDFPGPATVSTATVTTDASGNTFAIASYGGTPDFGSGALQSGSSNWDTAVVKFDTTGKELWSTAIYGSLAEFGEGIAVDGAGDVYAVGLSSSASFSVGTTTNAVTLVANQTSGYVVKLSGSTGAFVWGKAVKASATGSGTCPSVAANASHVVIGCSFAGTSATIGSTTVSGSEAASEDQLVAVLDLAGNVQWMRRIGGPGADDVLGGVAIDATGAVVATGQIKSATPAFVDSMNTSTMITRQGTTPNTTLMWMDASGNLARQQCFGSPTSSSGQSSMGNAVAVDPAGNAYMTGRFNGTFDAKGATLTAVAGTGACGFFGGAAPCADAFVVGVSKSTGATIFQKQIGGANDELGMNIAVSGCNLLVSGLNLSASLSIDGMPIASPTSDITSQGPWAMFAASYDLTGKIQWAKGLVSADPSAAISPGGGAFTSNGIRIGLGVQGSVSLDGMNVYNAGSSGQRFIVWALDR